MVLIPFVHGLNTPRDSHPGLLGFTNSLVHLSFRGLTQPIVCWSSSHPIHEFRFPEKEAGKVFYH